MFSNKQNRLVPNAVVTNESVSSAAPQRSSGVPSIISADMTIRGNLKCAGRLQIEGTVLGDIEVGQLVISDGAVVQGEIDAQEVEISGALTGLVRAREISLKATARVVGDLHHEILAIDPGADLEGQCRKLTAEAQATSSSRADYRPESRSDSRLESRSDSRLESRSDPRSDLRSDPRLDPRSDQRGDLRSELSIPDRMMAKEGLTRVV